jgi:hypothetical protein
MGKSNGKGNGADNGKGNGSDAPQACSILDPECESCQ